MSGTGCRSSKHLGTGVRLLWGPTCPCSDEAVVACKELICRLLFVWGRPRPGPTCP